MEEARAHVLAPSAEVPGDFFTLDGWSVSLVGNEVRLTSSERNNVAIDRVRRGVRNADRVGRKKGGGSTEGRIAVGG